MQAETYRSGYFVSEESEKAAKWDMLQNLRSERSRISVLHQQAETTGKQLENLGRVLANSAWTFKIEDGRITGKSSVHGDSINFSAPLSILDQDAIAKLITDINETQKSINTLQERLKNDLP